MSSKGFRLVLVLVILLVGVGLVSAQERVHVVQRGDSLTKIARLYNASAPAIAVRNAITNPNLIYPGQRLIIPSGSSTPVASGRTHVVRQGQTLRDIAALYGTTWQAISTLNRLPNANIIYAGQVLQIPTGTVVVPSQPVHPVQPVTCSTVNGYYLVRAGDTLSGIARCFGVDMYNIARANAYLNLNRIYAGVYMRIPGR